MEHSENKGLNLICRSQVTIDNVICTVQLKNNSQNKDQETLEISLLYCENQDRYFKSLTQQTITKDELLRKYFDNPCDIYKELTDQKGKIKIRENGILHFVVPFGTTKKIQFQLRAEIVQTLQSLLKKKDNQLNQQHVKVLQLQQIIKKQKERITQLQKQVARLQATKQLARKMHGERQLIGQKAEQIECFRKIKKGFYIFESWLPHKKTRSQFFSICGSTRDQLKFIKNYGACFVFTDQLLKGAIHSIKFQIMKTQYTNIRMIICRQKDQKAYFSSDRGQESLIFDLNKGQMLAGSNHYENATHGAKYAREDDVFEFEIDLRQFNVTCILKSQKMSFEIPQILRNEKIYLAVSLHDQGDCIRLIDTR